MKKDGGVRGLKQALESIVLHVNKLRLIQDPDTKKRPHSRAAVLVFDESEKLFN